MLTDALSTPRNRNWTLVLLVTCGLLAIAAAAVGIDDNPPGILLALLSATGLVLAFVHPWRTSRRFMHLLYASALGFVVFGILHNVFDAIASNLGGSGLLQDVLNGASAVLFLIATLICPPGVLVGVVGALVMFIRNRHRPTPGPTTPA